MSRATASQVAVSAVGVATAWVATWGWGGLIAEPFRYIGPGLVAALLIGAVGIGVRALRGPFWATLIAQVVVVLVWFQHRQHTGGLVGGWVPTPDSLRRLADQIGDGAHQVDHYAAPVPAVHAQTSVYLLAVSILLIIGVDLIAAGLRRAPWAGLPLIVALTVPISVLDAGLPKPVFVLTGILFALLLATVEAERVLSWGQAVTGRRRREDAEDQVLEGASLAAPALKIALLTAVVALVLPLLVPIGASSLERRHHDANNKNAGGSGGNVVLTNPIADLKRDLVSNLHIPLLDVITDAKQPSYVRISVLDQFTGDKWQPSARTLSSGNKADGDLPLPAGFRDTTPGAASTWNLTTTPDFRTSWLPTPYVTRRIEVDHGDWRYNPSTMDIASADKTPPSDLSYALDAYVPSFDPTALVSAGQAPPQVLDPMTKVPDLDPRVTSIAQQVTASGRTDYDKAVLLQDWFRTKGGFTYSLNQRAGSGMAELVRFITVDKIGYCEQYAAAMAVMMRSLGIPARVVVGFLDGKKVGPDSYSYTSDDLHAWPEVYFSGSGWVRFEPTPGVRTGVAPAWTRGAKPTTPSQAPSATPSAVRPTPVNKPKPVDTNAGSSSSGGSSRLPVVLLLVALLVLASFTPVLVRRAQRARRLTAGADDVRTASALWEELYASAIDLGLSWPEGRSVRAVSEALIRWAAAGPDDAAALGRLVTLVERARYSREFALADGEHEDGRRTVERWSVLLAGAVRPRQARVARVLPRSIFRRLRADVPAPSLTEVG